MCARQTAWGGWCGSGAGRVSGHADDCTLQGRAVPVLRRRARLERGLGRPGGPVSVPFKGANLFAPGREEGEAAYRGELGHLD